MRCTTSREAPPMNYSEIVEQLIGIRPAHAGCFFFSTRHHWCRVYRTSSSCAARQWLDVVRINTGVANSIDSDLNNIRTMSTGEGNHFSPACWQIIKETAATMHEEVNYENECNGNSVLKDLDPALRIPKPYRNHKTETMEYVEGTPLKKP